ncbi:MAG: pitrilysin family protein [Paracoccaceae bacterium]|jgi:predicted Zn-dependent peptidase|nr:pitrilysin family protein [Paracoccaceae bacterium]
MTETLHTFSNGFRVVTENMPGLESATVGIWVNAGGRHETTEQNGIAHFLEHMAFKGTRKRTALEIAEQIEDVGGYINAYTSKEVTAYYARVLKNDVNLALEVIGDIVLNPLFDKNEIEVERGVILQEIGMSLDTPDDVIFDWLQDSAYPDQPFGRTILGPSEKISQFTKGDLSKFIKQHYSPDRLILSAVGAVDHDQIVRLAENIFGHLSRVDPTPTIPAKFSTGSKKVVKKLEQAHYALAFEGCGYRHDDFFAAQIFSSAFGGGMSSRLFQEVREKRGLCYSIFSQLGAYSDTGLMTIYAGTSEDSVKDLSDIIIDELKRASVDLSESEVTRARAQMKAGLLMGLESSSARAERLARLVGIWGKVPKLKETIRKIDNVCLDQVRNFSQELTLNKKVAMATYGPVKRSRSLQDIKDRLSQ